MTHLGALAIFIDLDRFVCGIAKRRRPSGSYNATNERR